MAQKAGPPWAGQLGKGSKDGDWDEVTPASLHL